MTEARLFDQLGEGPAVMLVHAGIADRRMWRDELPWLAGLGRHAIAPDLPGFGEHAPTADPPAPWDFLAAVLDELGIDQAVLVGCSFGGAVALRLAVTAPQRVRALVLISSPAPGLEPSDRLRAAWADEEEAMERGDIDAAVDAVLSAWLDPSAPADLRDRVGTMQRRAFELDPRGEMPQPDDPLDTHHERVSEVEVPALVAAGEHDMPEFLWSARRLAETLPHATHRVIADAGHLAPLEAPATFRAMVDAFLASVD
jgi:3-oxoadipate enol-lactonase